MKRLDLRYRKFNRAYKIASRCREVGVRPPAWVRYLLGIK